MNSYCTRLFHWRDFIIRVTVIIRIIQIFIARPMTNAIWKRSFRSLWNHRCSSCLRRHCFSSCWRSMCHPFSSSMAADRLRNAARYQQTHWKQRRHKNRIGWQWDGQTGEVHTFHVRPCKGQLGRAVDGSSACVCCPVVLVSSRFFSSQRTLIKDRGSQHSARDSSKAVESIGGRSSSASSFGPRPSSLAVGPGAWLAWSDEASHIAFGRGNVRPSPRCRFLFYSSC